VPAREAEPRAFRPSARLRQAKEFAAVLASPLRSRAGCFELRYCPNEGLDMARLGLVIPKRLASRAVLRNLIKRLARESFRHLAHRLPAVDIVVRLAAPALPKLARVDDIQRSLWRRHIDALLAGILSRQPS
jgi:ribonuclease P protein component